MILFSIENSESLCVCSVLDSEGANRVLKILEADETEMSQNWSKRYRENLDKMKTGDIFEVADVVRNLSFKQKEKGTLSTGEKKMLNNAKVILVSELSLAENSSQDEIEKLVDNKIEMSYKEYRVPTEAKIDLQQNAVNKFIPFNGDTNTTNT